MLAAKMVGSFWTKYARFFYNKFPFDEIWYHYLTGEWRVTPPEGLERRVLELKGISEKIPVRVAKFESESIFRYT